MEGSLFVHMYQFASSCLYCYSNFCLLLFSFYPQYPLRVVLGYWLAYLPIGYSRSHLDSINWVVTSLYQSTRLNGLTCTKITSTRVMRIGVEMSINLFGRLHDVFRKIFCFISLSCIVCPIGFLKYHLFYSITVWIACDVVCSEAIHPGLQLEPQVGVNADPEVEVRPQHQPGIGKGCLNKYMYLQSQWGRVQLIHHLHQLHHLIFIPFSLRYQQVLGRFDRHQPQQHQLQSCKVSLTHRHKRFNRHQFMWPPHQTQRSERYQFARRICQGILEVVTACIFKGDWGGHLRVQAKFPR